MLKKSETECYTATEEKEQVVAVIVPYSPAHTPSGLFERAIATARKQSISTEIVVVEDTEQRGPAWARNQGLDRTDNRYVAFLDADDLWHEEKLQHQLTAMNRTGAGICVEAPELDEHQFMRELYLGNIASIMSSVLVDTERVDARFDETLERREDHLYVLEAANQAGLCFCQDIFTVGGHDESLSTDTPTIYRLRQDYRFARRISDRVPDVTTYLNNYYTSIRCDPTFPNTPGDLLRMAFLWPSLKSMMGMVMSIICQRLLSH